MNASHPGSPDWWRVVLSMPHTEALIHLNDYRVGLLRANAGKGTHAAAGHEITKVNAEIKRINLLMDNATWRNAARNVLPPELFEEVLLEKRRLEDMGRMT